VHVYLCRFVLRVHRQFGKSTLSMTSLPRRGVRVVGIALLRRPGCSCRDASPSMVRCGPAATSCGGVRRIRLTLALARHRRLKGVILTAARRHRASAAARSIRPCIAVRCMHLTLTDYIRCHFRVAGCARMPQHRSDPPWRPEACLRQAALRRGSAEPLRRPSNSSASRRIARLVRGRVEAKEASWPMSLEGGAHS
jgi:hypothetical protein